MVPVTTYGPFGLASIVTSAMTILPLCLSIIISEHVLGWIVLVLETGGSVEPSRLKAKKSICEKA